MTTAPAQLRSLYRAFLRELPPISQSPTQLHQRLRRSFSPGTRPSTSSSSSDAVASAATPRNMLQQSEQYLLYLRAQRTYLTLLERYNPGLALDASSADVEDRERVQATARRVGMHLPGSWGAGSGGK